MILKNRKEILSASFWRNKRIKDSSDDLFSSKNLQNIRRMTWKLNHFFFRRFFLFSGPVAGKEFGKIMIFAHEFLFWEILFLNKHNDRFYSSLKFIPEFQKKTAKNSFLFSFYFLFLDDWIEKFDFSHENCDWEECWYLIELIKEKLKSEILWEDFFVFKFFL